MAPGELALEASFPVLHPAAGTAFVEVARRHGDYAVCGVAAHVQLGPDGAISSARAAYLLVAATPLVLDLSEAFGADGAGAVGGFVRANLEPEPDIHATADYRLQLAVVLTGRALAQAHAAARERSAA